MKVLSLFDGISCGQVALQRVGVPVEKYYASEINKHSIAVTQKNFPNTIQLGDVRGVCRESIEDSIDLIIAGSPCQGFSKAGTGLNFEHKESKLFFEFIRILNEFAPRYFFLENVPMKKECEQFINNSLGVQPVTINSNLVSAQSRKRLYWTNIPLPKEPLEDRGLVGSDILEKGLPPEGEMEVVFPTPKLHHAGTRKVGIVNLNGYECRNRVYGPQGKLTTLTLDTNCPKVQVGERGWRRLTCIERERLQTLPDNYTLGVSDSQRMKTCGDGWTVDVIAYFFKNLQGKNLLES